MIGTGLAQVTIQVIPAPVRVARPVRAIPVPVRAIRPVRDREALRCAACGLSPILE